MPSVKVIEADGTVHLLEAAVGGSLMQLVTTAGLAGLVGECGGSAMCATCHVYVDEKWLAKLSTPLASELEMLECTAAQRRPESRLSCQIPIAQALDGLVVRLPDCQV